jgi:hypothetical protein
VTADDRELLLSALDPLVDRALSRIDRGECPIRLQPFVELGPDGGVMLSSTVEIEIGLHTRRCIDVGDLKRAGEATRMLAREAGLTWFSELVGRDPENYPGSRANAAFVGIATEIVKACHAGVARQRAIASAIERFERFAAMTECTWVVRAPVRGISILDGPHLLSDKVLIRRADEDFKLALWAAHGPGANPFSALSERDATVVRDFDAVVEMTYTTPRDGWALSPSIAEEINWIVTALRVYGARRLAVPLRWTQGPPEFDSFGRGQASVLEQDRSALDRAWRLGSELSVDAARASELRGWIGNFVKRPTDDALMFATQRFNLCDERVSDDDRLVDAWIALEALFSTKRERGAITYRTALRLATLLGRTPGDRQRIRDLVGLSYGLRSEVVHGTPVHKRSGKYAPAADITSQTEDLLRETLRLWVRSGYGDSASVVSMLEGHVLKTVPLGAAPR